jgi:glycine oxidase
VTSPSPDVVIVGGGVIGCATAYFLAAEHHTRCLIFERNAIASEASGGAAGELAASELAGEEGHGFPDIFTRFLLEGIELHSSLAPALVEESGMDYLLADLPMLRPAFSEDDAKHIQALAAEQAERGIRSEWLEPESLRAMESWVAEDAVGAVYSTERQLEAYPFAVALTTAAERHGVQIRTGEVTGLERSGDRVRGVHVGGETVGAERVVVANGPWSKHASEWLGIDIPVKPLRGQIVHLDLPPGMQAPRHAIFHDSGYLLPKTSGDLLAGTTMEDVGFDRGSTMEARNTIMEAVARLAPATQEAPIRDTTACLRPYSEDGLPIIGAVPGADGLYLATGHGFKGITLCLITGWSLAQLIARGTTDFPLDDFSPARLVQG